MYHPDPRLDTPPPTSQFRRPWSPDPYVSLPSNVLSGDQQANDYDFQGVSNERPPHLQTSSQRQRREGSDVSVEALDLADYARTLRARQAGDSYPSFDPYVSYPPFPLRPARDSLQPPSLVSREGTFSSNAPTSSSHSRNPARRPFSLPPPSRGISASSRHPNRSPNLAEPQVYTQNAEIDISHFPAWSRSWYRPSVPGVTPSSPPDIYTPLPISQFKSTSKISPFDPGYSHNERHSFPDSYRYAPASSLDHDSTRDLLPWSNDSPDYGPSIDSNIKEERMRMLEREFGPKAKGKGRASGEDDFLDENGKPLIGTVDTKGNLVTQGPKKRIAVRVLQILMALAASIPSIYAALVIKPQEPPPPSKKPPAFVLYILSVITLLILLYLFVFRPCCCSGKRRKGSPSNPLVGGMMVLPVQGLPGGKKGPKDKKKGKGGKNAGQGDVQVNLIVDPEAFGRRDEDSSEDDDGEWDGSIPGGYDSNSARKKRRRAKRRGVFAGLAMEEEWKRARAWAKKLAIVDVAGTILWGAAFVYILIGKRCPSGAFEGWCNAYNVSTAAACLLCVTFGLSTFFDVKDLHASKTSPRTRN